MDGLIIWKSLTLFVFTMLFFWVIFYTFQPGFFDPQDKRVERRWKGYSGSDALYQTEEELLYSYIV